jgi:hypothetical protein
MLAVSNVYLRSFGIRSLTSPTLVCSLRYQVPSRGIATYLTALGLVEDITEALCGTRVDLNKKMYGTIDTWRQWLEPISKLLAAVDPI